jgi:hypothetical protein
MATTPGLGEVPTGGDSRRLYGLGFDELGKREEHERWKLRPSIYRVEAGRRRSRGPEWRPGRGVRRCRGVLLCIDGGEEGDDALLALICTKRYPGWCWAAKWRWPWLLLGSVGLHVVGCTSR